MTNSNMLASKMALAGDKSCSKRLAEILGVSYPTANKKANGKLDFTQSEIEALVKHYGWTRLDILPIFFWDDER